MFSGWLRIGFEERPALFASEEATTPPPPAGSVRVEPRPGLAARYGFGIGGAPRGGTARVVALHGLLAAGPEFDRRSL